jgi:hypothetical protein
VDSQPLMGLNDLTHESIVSSTWLSSIASSQMRGTGQNTQLGHVSTLTSFFLTFHLLQLTSYNSPLTTYEHYDLLLRMIDKASQIEEAERDLPHVLD